MHKRENMRNRSAPSLEDIYDKAREFLISQIPSKDAESVLEHYLSLPDKSQLPVSLEELYLRLLASAQNANMKAGGHWWLNWRSRKTCCRSLRLQPPKGF